VLQQKTSSIKVQIETITLIIYIYLLVKYFRISPATRFLMLQLGYTENDLPKDKMVVNKYVLQEAIKKGLKKSLATEPTKDNKKSIYL